MLLPGHIHCIWTLPYGDTDFSTQWGLIKAGFSKRMKKAEGRSNADISQSRIRQRESSYWQRRFWEHGIRDQRYYNSHMDYIHFNPVKHGLVSAPNDWEYSSFHRMVDEGVYDIEWGTVDKMEFKGIGRE